jgi:hypothetical protein
MAKNGDIPRVAELLRSSTLNDINQNDSEVRMVSRTYINFC